MQTPAKSRHKGGRRKLPVADKRSRVITVKVTEAEHAAYHARAEATGREVPGWLRYLAAADLSQVPQTAKRAP